MEVRASLDAAERNCSQARVAQQLIEEELQEVVGKVDREELKRDTQTMKRPTVARHALTRGEIGRNRISFRDRLSQS